MIFLRHIDWRWVGYILLALVGITGVFVYLAGMDISGMLLTIASALGMAGAKRAREKEKGRTPERPEPVESPATTEYTEQVDEVEDSVAKDKVDHMPKKEVFDRLREELGDAKE